MSEDTTKSSDEKPTFLAWLKSLFRSIGHFLILYPLATVLTVFLVVGAVLLAIFGKNIQLGGVIGWLWGKVHPRDQPGAPVVIPPSGRTDDKGQVINPGKSDDKGFVQSPVVLPIKDPGIFSDPTTVTVTHPDGHDVVIPLPRGVKNADVKEIILVAPNVYQISNNDTGVNATKILEDLK